MSLENRLKQLESKMSARNILLKQSYDPDAFIKHLGLDLPAARALARSSGKSIVEVTCEMIGIEPREFQRMLREKANLAR